MSDSDTLRRMEIADAVREELRSKNARIAELESALRRALPIVRFALYKNLTETIERLLPEEKP